MSNKSNFKKGYPMTAKNLSYVFALLTIVSSTYTFAYRPTEAQIKNISKEVVDAVLYKEIGLASGQLPYSYQYDYNRTVDDVTQSLKRLLEKTASIVFKTNLDSAIADEVEKRLKYYYLTKNDITESIGYEFQLKLAAARERLERKMYDYYKADYVTLKDIEDAVRYEIDYYFAQKIKNAKGYGQSWISSLGKFGVDLAIGICESLANKDKANSQKSSPTNQSSDKPDKFYYSENCTICQFNFLSGERVGVLSCGHTYHPDCIKPWLAQHKSCPICRTQNVHLAKIYDSKEYVPGYKPTISTFSQNINPIVPKEEKKETTSTSKPEKFYYSDNCVVCQDDFEPRERVGVLSCGHTFHPDCIKPWLAKQKTCPLCRAQNVFLAKIYDSRELVPGYKPKVSNSQKTTTIELPECSICLDDIQTINCKTLKCGHKFHKLCIDDWLSRSKTCPYCRSTNI